jgi:hypothetical protein
VTDDTRKPARVRWLLETGLWDTFVDQTPGKLAEWGRGFWLITNTPEEMTARYVDRVGFTDSEVWQATDVEDLILKAIDTYDPERQIVVVFHDHQDNVYSVYKLRVVEP